MWRGSTVGTGWRAWLVAGVARSAPRSNSWFWIGRQLGRQALAQAGRERDADLRVELVDRAVRLDPLRSLATRWPPPSPVIPSSPVFV